MTYTALLEAAVQQGEANQAAAVLAEMRAAGVRPNVITYNTLLRCTRPGESLADAFADVLKSMAQDGLQPNVDTFNTIIG